MNYYKDMGKLTCQDLMVGDWVNYKSPSSGKLHPIKIENIYGVEFNCEVEDWNIISGKSISDTEPIELTEEILAKNGFIFNNGYAVLQVSEDTYLDFYKNEHRLRKVWEGIDEWNNHAKVRDVSFVCQCYYVHEFQHALRLAGVQKEIEL